jgi:hypothetical protein
MKRLKTLAIAVLCAAALLALAGTAAATTFTSPANTTYTGTIKGGGTVTSHGVTTVTCNTTFEVEIEQHGSSATAGGVLTKSTGECGTGNHVTIEAGGTGLAHTEKEASNGNGILTVTGSSTKVVLTSLGITCVYTTNNTEVGLIEGSNEKAAVLVVDGASIPRTGGSFFCGSSSELTGTLTATSPSTLSVD